MGNRSPRARTSSASRQRVAALPPEDRRAAIIAATIPVVIAHGATVTTRQLAEAAGVAEGTIFHVFTDKQSLIDAVFDAVFDPSRTDGVLADIDPSLSFELRLQAAVRVVQGRLQDLWRLAPLVDARSPKRRAASRRSNRMSALVAMFEAERDRLNCEPEIAAQLLRGLTMAASHPVLFSETPLQPDQIVMLLLDGIRKQDPC
ncbi:MAG: putative transcriptional regulator, TetR family [Ilumatobacteraceae bacterium]|nr:putative transcriptional regulator, TetR family [Ilumatobacteraceae bacterium]